MVTKSRVRRTRERYNKREAVAGYLFILPWIAGFLTFTAGAMIYSLRSRQDSPACGSLGWAGS